MSKTYYTDGNDTATVSTDELNNLYVQAGFSPQQPYRCPICEGRGLVRTDFYLVGTRASTAPEKCRSCAGTGVLWR